MSDISEEWKKIRQELGNFMCKLDNATNRAISTDEQRQKVYDAAFESGWVNGRNDLWDSIDDYFAVASDGMERHQLAVNMGHTSFGDIVSIMSPDTFTERLTKYHEDHKKKKCDISPSDECYYLHLLSSNGNGNNNCFVITRIYEGEDGLEQPEKFFDAIYHDGRTISDGTLRLVAKTGNHYPILSSLNTPFDEQQKEDEKDGSI